MRINLNCPFKDKDKVKALGAKWDSIQRVWYIVDVEDLTPFMYWITSDEMTKPEQQITLKAYLGTHYRGAAIGLSFKAAMAFGIPYPPEKGWAKKFGDRSISAAQMNSIAKKTAPSNTSVEAPKPGREKNKKKNQRHTASFGITGMAKPASCSCKVQPWEDCEHTEAAANKAMLEMIGA